MNANGGNLRLFHSVRDRRRSYTPCCRKSPRRKVSTKSSARNDTNFVELSQEDEAAFQALEDDYEGANDKNENEIDNIITVET